MPSTYSALKIELIGTGDQAGTWGATTNVNLGTALEEAITGSANVTFASSNTAIALTDTNATQTARNLRLNLVGTITNQQTLFIPAIEKQYIVTNGLSNSVVISNGSNATPTGTTVTVPAGKSMLLYNDGSNVADVITQLVSLALTNPLGIGSGGTGLATIGSNGTVLTSNGTVASWQTPAAGGITRGKSIAMAMIFGF